MNDYTQDREGKWVKKSDVLNDPNSVTVNPDAGFFEATKNKISQDTRGIGNSLGALGANIIGANESRDSFIKDAQRNQEISNAYSKDYQDVTKIKSLGDAVKFGGYQIANFGVTALPSVAAGTLAGALTGGAPGATAGAVAGAGNALTGGAVVKSLIKNFAQKNAAKLAIGAVAGSQNLGQVNYINIGNEGKVLEDVIGNEIIIHNFKYKLCSNG